MMCTAPKYNIHNWDKGDGDAPTTEDEVGVKDR